MQDSDEKERCRTGLCRVCEEVRILFQIWWGRSLRGFKELFRSGSDSSCFLSFFFLILFLSYHHYFLLGKTLHPFHFISGVAATCNLDHEYFEFMETPVDSIWQMRKLRLRLLHRLACSPQSQLASELEPRELNNTQDLGAAPQPADSFGKTAWQKQPLTFKLRLQLQ